MFNMVCFHHWSKIAAPGAGAVWFTSLSLQAFAMYGYRAKGQTKGFLPLSAFRKVVKDWRYMVVGQGRIGINTKYVNLWTMIEKNWWLWPLFIYETVLDGVPYTWSFTKLKPSTLANFKLLLPFSVVKKYVGVRKMRVIGGNGWGGSCDYTRPLPPLGSSSVLLHTRMMTSLFACLFIFSYVTWSTFT